MKGTCKKINLYTQVIGDFVDQCSSIFGNFDSQFIHHLIAWKIYEGIKDTQYLWNIDSYFWATIASKLGNLQIRFCTI